MASDEIFGSMFWAQPPTQCGPLIGLARQTMGWTFLGVRETSALG